MPSSSLLSKLPHPLSSPGLTFPFILISLFSLLSLPPSFSSFLPSPFFQQFSLPFLFNASVLSSVPLYTLKFSLSFLLSRPFFYAPQFSLRSSLHHQFSPLFLSTPSLLSSIFLYSISSLFRSPLSVLSIIAFFSLLFSLPFLLDHVSSSFVPLSNTQFSLPLLLLPLIFVLRTLLLSILFLFMISKISNYRLKTGAVNNEL